MQPQEPANPEQPTTPLEQPQGLPSAAPVPSDSSQPVQLPSPEPITNPVVPQPTIDPIPSLIVEQPALVAQSAKPKSKKLLIEIIVFVLILVGAAVFVLARHSNSSTGSNESTSNGVDTSVSQAPADIAKRDAERVTDINQIATRLEAFYATNGFYPGLFNVGSLPGLDSEALKDPIGGNTLNFAGSATDKAAAQAAKAPAGDTSKTAAYEYVSYPTDCVNDCKGYVLKSYIEKPTDGTPNPYVKQSLN